MKFLGRYSDLAYALMRMVMAFLFMSHGYQRVFTGPIFPSDFPPLGVANVLEVILGPLLFLGLFTPIAAPSPAAMAVAHHGARVASGIIPLQHGRNHGRPVLRLTSPLRRRPLQSRCDDGPERYTPRVGTRMQTADILGVVRNDWSKSYSARRSLSAWRCSSCQVPAG